ncbi:MAG: FlgD immunoglobulin-like domain containing protein, partial [Gemmatimonadales bacterium]
FNPQTTIVFELARPERVELAIYDLHGSLVRTLVSEDRTAARHEVVWNGKDNNGQQVPSGVYMVRLQAGGLTQMSKLALVK